MPQERYNAEWVTENGVGVVLESFKDIRDGVRDVVGRMHTLRTNVERINNRAVFEIPEILEKILATPARVGVDFAQHVGSTKRLHLV
jgi:hypothetical protein